MGKEKEFIYYRESNHNQLRAEQRTRLNEMLKDKE